MIKQARQPLSGRKLALLLFCVFTLTLSACGGGGGDAPGGVTIIPGGGGGGGASLCDVSTGGCTVNWNAVVDARVTHYRVYIGTGTGNPVTVVNAQFVSIPDITVPTTSFNFSVQSLAAQAPAAGFVANATVSIAVSAVGANGIESSLSSPTVQTLI